MTSAVATATNTEPAAAVGDRRHLGRNLSVLGGSQVVTWTMSLLWTLVVPRALGPAGMGLMVTAWAVTGVLAVVLGLGTRNYLVREMVARPERAPSLLGTAMVLRLVLALPFFAGAVMFAGVIGLSHDGTVVLLLAAGATAMTLLAEPLQAGFQAIQRMEYLAYDDILDKVIQSVCGVVLIILGVRAVGLTAWWLIVAAGLLALNLHWMRSHLRVDVRTTPRMAGALVKASIPYWAFGLVFMVYLWIDSAMLAAMAPAEVVGWYGVPTKLFNTLMFLPVIVSTSWLPRLVTVFESAPESLNTEARIPMELVLALSIPIATAVAVLAQPVIRLLYGAGYERAIPVMVTLALCVPPMYLNIMLSQMLVAANRQGTWTRIMIGATAVNVVVNLVLIRYTQDRWGNGALGAAASLVLTEALIAALGIMVVGRGVMDHGSALRLVRALATGAGMALAMTAVSRFGAVPEIAGGAVSFVALSIGFRLLSAHELLILRGAISGLWARWLRGVRSPPRPRGGGTDGHPQDEISH